MSLFKTTVNLTSIYIIYLCSFINTVSPYGVKITGNNTYPHGSQLQLHCSSDGGPQLEYSWSRTNTLSNDTTTNTNNLCISNVTTLDGGNYTCTVTNDAGSSSNTVTVYGKLVHIKYFYISTKPTLYTIMCEIL